MNAIIFDLDGVLCHTDEYHYMAWKAIADELHIPFNREVNNQLRGVSRMESLELILRNSPVCYSEQEKFLLAEKKNNIYRELLQNITSKDLADGAWTVLEKLHAVHIPMAIGSSSKNTPLIVEKLGIGKFFDAIVDGNQISHSKPDPEVFLLAAEKLHQKPSDCLVVEDAEAGVKAALNGGFLVAGIGPANPVQRLADAGKLVGVKDEELTHQERQSSGIRQPSIYTVLPRRLEAFFVAGNQDG